MRDVAADRALHAHLVRLAQALVAARAILAVVEQVGAALVGDLLVAHKGLAAVPRVGAHGGAAVQQDKELQREHQPAWRGDDRAGRHDILVQQLVDKDSSSLLPICVISALHGSLRDTVKK